jgi:eukaryotic-like serine/threonine-protein kinase
VNGSPADDTRIADGPSLAGPTADLPATIGEYRILRRLGEGGMGVVYEAEQPNPRRRVALKVVRGAEFTDPLRVRLFQREAQTLARLEHSDIAAVYQAGQTPEGLHFLAMELVPGRTLDAFLASRPVAIDRDELVFRLRLIVRLADAVHYAHQRGVIHRDLKPSNIIVTAPDVSGPPGIKILDFGIARVIDAETKTTLGSVEGLVKGTLPYMSPEQARGDPGAIDVRTDVYALGVVAYETLAGVRPYDPGSSLLAALKVICETPPTPLQQVWRGVTPLDPDVAIIVNKALAKAADERYTSAAALADDLRRYLSSEPILARAPTFTYQLRKLVARRKGSFALAGAALALVVGLAIGMSVLYVRSQQNLKRALAAENDARQSFGVARNAVDRYLTQVAESPELKAHGLEDLRRQLLDTAREFYVRLTTLPAGTVASHSAAMDLGRAWRRVANISRTIGEGKKAEDANAQALSLYEAERRTRPDDPEVIGAVAAALGDLALVRFESGQYAPAEDSFTQANALNADVVQRQPTDDWRVQQANVLDNYAQLLERTKRIADSERTYKQAQAIREKLAAASPANIEYRHSLLMSDVNLGALYARANRLSDAEAELMRATSLGEKLVADAPAVPDYQHALAASWGNLAGVHMLQERFDLSAADYARELPTRERLASEHPTVLDYRLQLGSSYTNLGELAVRQKKYGDALPWLEKSIDTLQWVVTREPRHQIGRYYLSYTWSWKARALEGLARWRDAIPAWQAAIDFDDRNDQELRAGLADARRHAGA